MSTTVHLFPSYYHCDWKCNACAYCGRYWFSISHRLHYCNDIGNVRKVLSFSEGSLIEIKQCTDWFFPKIPFVYFLLVKWIHVSKLLGKWKGFQIWLHILKKKKNLKKKDVKVEVTLHWEIDQITKCQGLRFKAFFLFSLSARILTSYICC